MSSDLLTPERYRAELENSIEWAERDAMVAATTAEARRHLRHADRLRHDLEEFFGLCHTCHGKGQVWDSSGECARRQTSRCCPVCGGNGKSAAKRER